MKASSVIRLKVKEDWTESFTEGLSTRVFWITFRVTPSISTGSDSCCATIDRWMKRVAIRLGVVISVLVVRVPYKSSGIKFRVQKDWTSFTKAIHMSLIWSTFGLAPSISTGSFALCDLCVYRYMELKSCDSVRSGYSLHKPDCYWTVDASWQGRYGVVPTLASTFSCPLLLNQPLTHAPAWCC